MYADLHLHTVYSDGTDTPREIFALASQNSINTIAITDHDCVDGVKEAHTFVKEFDIRLIDGAEISTMHHGRYVHVLGYYIDTENAYLAEYITESAKDKTDNTLINFNHARDLGVFEYSWERVLELNPSQKRLTGLHVVGAMRRDGYEVPGMGYYDFFGKYFLAFSDQFIDTEKKTPFEAIDIIKKCGGIPVLAHPKLIGSDEYLMEFIDYGAEGLEAYHPIHSPEETQKYLEIANAKGLYVSGGTDWHGGNNSSSVKGFGMCGLDHWDYSLLHIR